MKGINKAIIVGNLGDDPTVNNGVTRISVATSTGWKDKQTGEHRERTEWHRVVLFKRLGEIAAEYLKKGSQVYIEGYLQTSKWEKDGVDRYTTEIIANKMQMLGGRDKRGTVPDSGNPNPASVPGQDFNDEIPF